MARKAKALKKKPADNKKKPSHKKSGGVAVMSAAGVPVKVANWKAMAMPGKSPTIEVGFEDGSTLEMRDLAAAVALTMLQTGPCFKMANPNGIYSYSGRYGAV